MGFEIYAPSPEILAKMYPNFAFQAKCQKNPTFPPISLDPMQIFPIFHYPLLVYMKNVFSPKFFTTYYSIVHTESIQNFRFLHGLEAVKTEKNQTKGQRDTLTS